MRPGLPFSRLVPRRLMGRISGLGLEKVLERLIPVCLSLRDLLRCANSTRIMIYIRRLFQSLPCFLFLTLFPTLSYGMSHGAEALDTGDTAWMLTATALVLFMTLPGLALFYGGLVRSKNILSVLMHCFAIACLASLPLGGWAVQPGIFRRQCLDWRSRTSFSQGHHGR